MCPPPKAARTSDGDSEKYIFSALHADVSPMEVGRHAKLEGAYGVRLGEVVLVSL